jgi:hypothetical protein
MVEGTLPHDLLVGFSWASLYQVLPLSLAQVGRPGYQLYYYFFTSKSSKIIRSISINILYTLERVNFM